MEPLVCGLGSPAVSAVNTTQAETHPAATLPRTSSSSSTGAMPAYPAAGEGKWF